MCDETYTYFRYFSDVRAFVLFNTLMVVLCYSLLTLYQSGAPLLNYIYYCLSDSQMPVPVAGRSRAWVYGHSHAGIVGSNPSGAWMSVCY
jgi:hypothetical protein